MKAWKYALKIFLLLLVIFVIGYVVHTFWLI